MLFVNDFFRLHLFCAIFWKYTNVKCDIKYKYQSLPIQEKIETLKRGGGEINYGIFVNCDNGASVINDIKMLKLLNHGKMLNLHSIADAQYRRILTISFILYSPYIKI